MNENLIDLLKKELQLLDASGQILKISYEHCLDIGTKNQYTIEELDKYEALTSRFARVSDILIQKIFRIVDELDLETPGSIRDRINRAEKKKIISSAETFSEIRILRNEIAHEYLPEEIERIFAIVMEMTPKLLEAIEKTQNYCQKYF